jgi:hypothetical protein
MAEHIDFYRARRARQGFGKRKIELIERFWQLENEITHFIIAGAAGSKDYIGKRADAEAERDAVENELRVITRET